MKAYRQRADRAGPEGALPVQLGAVVGAHDDVLRFLVPESGPANTISAQGFGDSRPVASNDTAEGRAKNRRVEIVIMAASRP
ncbi:MAG: OmpA family protein [Comamonadaceae bacterium]|nr:OmpA family protein [Comamonadaceae bacterium]